MTHTQELLVVLDRMRSTMGAHVHGSLDPVAVVFWWRGWEVEVVAAHYSWSFINRIEAPDGRVWVAWMVLATQPCWVLPRAVRRWKP